MNLVTRLLKAVCIVLMSSAALAEGEPTARPGPAAGAETPADTVLFDFEEEADIGKWSNVDVYALREAESKAAYDAAAKAAADPAKVAPYKPLVQPPKEPDVKVEWTTEGASGGKHAMKLTFAGGRMPTVAAKPPTDDWRRYRAFHVTVTVPRTCMVVFRVMAGASRYGTSYNDGCSRWEFAARCEAGRNTLVTAPPRNNVLWTGITSFEITMYAPREGESIIVDHVYLSSERPTETSPFNDALAAPRDKRLGPADGYKVLGTELVVRDVDELADRLKETWTKPEDRTVEEVESAFRAEYETLKKTHPDAVLTVLRDGQPGYDPAAPEKPFAGWEDAGTPSHLPMGLTLACFRNAGGSGAIETCFRHRPGFLRCDLSSIPKDARILAARLIVVRSAQIGKYWETKPTMFVVEPCRRHWKELEVNVFEYAKDGFWNDYAAETWGEDGDCDAVLLAHGPGRGGACDWDFTHAVRYWTTDGHPNHGFILYGAPRYVDYLNIFSRECGETAKRPAVMVVYEPKE